MGSTERIQSPAVRERAPNERERHSGRTLPESRFHRQRHPEHVGAGKTGILSRPLEHFTEWLGDRKNAAFGHFMTLVHHVSYGLAGLKIEKFR